ncbi:hypothetical protein [Flavobacterium gawalongense]|uniref:Uncharacterized protein n=1 Tax=Flavobacterium gawalongense TaxID=2594432 RepID=A0A553BLD5_9FLAO|nr:hypothetical protein [Flavobacterium gawalongense]TRX00856.1 hypothetical protein FNW33_11375 [Flavobacterium gawalongense]TRX05157.1 hypothetical protein FNW12_11830 [Flavobacterium gawalongense]TRX09064.1 hypothetical protein FNW11_10005 [Flavobacterium gawalongense]TRX10199.1 hypothetical protein FNW10_09850 [Flavobacterium gawalongense]TRX27133.1 hypothetical protein FNW38_09765 [Flavobacterium gawalongense]
MKTSKYFSKKDQSLIDYKNIQNKEHQLTHSKFETTITLVDASGNKKTPNPLLLLMYSKENEVLFI